MRIRREDTHGEATVNLTSLMDLMFILLIFFMATMVFAKEERDIEVNLPETAQQQRSISAASKLLIINVRRPRNTAHSNFYVVASKPMTLQQLHELVSESIEKDKDQKVLIRGDREAFHGQVAAAVAICRGAGVRQAKIGYDYTPITK